MFFDDARDMKEIEGTVFSAPPTAFDPVTGYRWLGGGIRMVRVIRGEVVIDNVFDANSHGYHCTHEYRPARASDRTFRFIALGDSFTNCINQTRAWPETLQGLLRIRKEGARLLHQAQAQGIARHFALEYFDGYQAFEAISPEAIVDFYWLKHDGHWAAGANLYAVRLAEWLIRRRFWEWRR